MQPFTKTYKNNAHLFYENDRSKELYIIQTGKVKVYRKIGGKDVVLAFLNPGAVLGEMALIDGKPRSASAIAFEETKAIVIDAETFYKKIAGVPSWFLSMIRTTSSKIRKANSRLEAMQSSNNCFHAVLALRYCFMRTNSKNTGFPILSLSLDETVTFLMQIQNVNYQSVLQLFEVLQSMNIIDIKDTLVVLVNEAKLVMLCEYLRNVFRKSFEKIAVVDSHIHEIVRSMQYLYDAQTDVSEKGKEITAADLLSVLSTVNNNQDKQSLLSELRELGIVCTVKVAGSQSDMGQQIFIVPSIFEKYVLYNTFKDVVSFS